MTQTEEADVADPTERNARKANPIDAHVGSRVRLRRMLLGMSQEKLAEKLGLTFQQVQKYEKGVNRIGASRLFELAQLLGVGVDFFYEDAPVLEGGVAVTAGFAEQGGENYIVDFLNSREGLELNRAFTRITDPKVRRSVIDLVKTIANDDTPSE
jgi:transcriptional regulator with XRE-family HTH domain